MNKPFGQHSDNFANGTSAVFVDHLYDQWKEDPQSVHSSWQAYFENIDNDVAMPYASPPSLGRVVSKDNSIENIITMLKSGQGVGVDSTSQEQAQSDAFKIMQFIKAFMTHGHLEANLDPLKLDEIVVGQTQYQHPSQDMKNLIKPEFYGFKQEDLDREFYVDVPHLGGILKKKKKWTIRELDTAFRHAYCNKIGVEYMHNNNPEQCKFVRNLFELDQYEEFSKESGLKLLDRIFWTDEFAQFISTKFNTMKRFGLEGVESFIPGMKALIDELQA